MSDFKHQEQAGYTADPAAVDLSVIIETYKALLTGDNLPERVAVQTVVLQTLLDAAHHNQRTNTDKYPYASIIFQTEAPTKFKLHDDDRPAGQDAVLTVNNETGTADIRGLQPQRVGGSMTPEEVRLEDLKQMASYTGSIVSFETSDPYYLASCDCCGWVGSSELCRTDSFGEDSDVYCPRCHSNGADSGKVAERINCKPVDVTAVRRQAFEEFSKAITNNDNFGFDDGISADWHPYPEYKIRKNIKDAIRALSAAPTSTTETGE